MELRAEYDRRRTEALAVDARFDRWSALFGNGRVVLVAVSLVAGLRAYATNRGQPWTLHLVMLGVFVVALALQSSVDRRRRAAQRRAALYARWIDRVDGKWTDFPTGSEKLADRDHAYARDLDVVGKGSLFQLVDGTRTAQGEATVASWLFEAAPVADVERRRETVRALVPELDARERLALPVSDDEAPRIDERPIVAWGEGPALLVVPLWMRVASFVLPVLAIAGLWALNEKLIKAWPVLLVLAAELAILVSTRRGVRAVSSVAEDTERTLLGLLPILEAAATMPGKTPRLAELDRSLSGAVDAVRSLRRRVTVFQSRANIIVALLSPVLMWDLHAASLLQSWQRKHGKAMRAWFAALGEIEALASFGTYASEHAADAWPELADGALAFEAEGLGHPLLPLERCVRNDVSLPGPGSVLLVTGSNMSGKSTLLRAVGLNAVLALAGLPVRAKRLRVSCVQVATAMRVSDSLFEGESFFLAEVKRLKRVTDLAGAGRAVLFLLDEILQGTNTRERSLGARGVVVHLSHVGAAGLVSTHDLSLVQLGQALGDKVAYAHFTDGVDGDRMTFDYLMRPGVVQTSNALRLMRAVGLKVEIPDEGPAERSPA